MAGWKQLLVAAACGFLSADSVRVSRVARSDVSSKMIAGVPVLNYDKAYGGKLSIADGLAEEDWIMFAKKTASDDELKNLCNLAGTCMRSGHPSKGGFSYFEVRGTEQDFEIILRAANGLVEFAEPDVSEQVIPEITSNTGAAAAASWGLDRVGAPLRGDNEGQSSHVFVLDTGIRRTHRDFGGRVIPTLDFSNGAATPCNGDLDCAGDIQGHGTHCAGSAAGGKFGVASKASIHSVRVLRNDGSGSPSWIYETLDFIATSNIRPAVASMSLRWFEVIAGFEGAIDAAVSSGVVVVVAGGNENSNACGYSPAYVPSAITVGSTTSTDVRSEFSNYGECTDIWAPGSDIVSASHSSDTGSALMSGTSMACPHVAGGAALILSKNPTLSVAEVTAELLGGAVVNAISDLKSGDTNALLYVGAGGPPPTPVPVPTPAPVVDPVCETGSCLLWYACWLSRCSTCPQCV